MCSMNVELNFKQWFAEAARWKSSLWAKPTDYFWERMEKYNSDEFFIHFESQTPQGMKAGKHLGVHVGKTMDESTPRGIYGFPVKYIFDTADTIGIMGSGEDWMDFAEISPHIWVFRAKNPDNVLHIRKIGDDAAKIYKMTEHDARVSTPGIKVGAIMTTAFLRMGIDGFVDWGTNTIHGGEPYQCVFFGQGKISVVDSFENTEWFSGRRRSTIGAPEL